MLLYSLTLVLECHIEMTAAMEEPASKWGVKISRVEVQDIAMPEEVETAMRLQMAAERKRRATVTEAEGEKSAAQRTRRVQIPVRHLAP